MSLIRGRIRLMRAQTNALELKVKELEPKVCAAPPDHEELVKCRAQVRIRSVLVWYFLNASLSLIGSQVIFTIFVKTC